MPKFNEAINLKARLDPDVHRAMKTKLAAEGRSFQDLIEACITEYLRQGSNESSTDSGKKKREPKAIRALCEIYESGPEELREQIINFADFMHGLYSLWKIQGA